MNIDTVMVTRLDNLVSQYQRMRQSSKYDDLSDLPDNEVLRQLTLTRAAIEGAAPQSSAYVRQAEEILKRQAFDGDKLALLIGVAESLSLDINSGYLKTVEELIHGDVFSDFLEMAQHLLSGGYKDAAAVICGSTLESHLRKLCIKNSIAVTNSSSKPKKADQLNADLTKANVYSLLDQKNVTAWLDLRNKAAHGHYLDYQKEQVALMQSGVMDFITRNPA